MASRDAGPDVTFQMARWTGRPSLRPSIRPSLRPSVRPLALFAVSCPEHSVSVSSPHIKPPDVATAAPRANVASWETSFHPVSASPRIIIWDVEDGGGGGWVGWGGK